MSNKIKYGIKKVHWALATIATDGSATYGTPVAEPGAVSISMEPQGEATVFYADDIVYYTGPNNAGYEGDLELALVSDTFKTQILGYKTDSKGVFYEDVNAPAQPFALMFEFNGDKKATRHVLYNCTASRSAVGSTTKTDTVEPQTESITIRATSIYSSALSTDITKGHTNASTDTTTYSTWYDAVVLPTA